ncbi:MAG: sulfite exporter TauE/SafE family protein [Alphaproteobacteria bacterium]|nr:sulfite exporter TauE/SafE family protein [Alphaproteobacteria bacterium]
MGTLDDSTLIAVGIAFLAGGLVKGVVGMGLPTVSIAVMGTVLGLHEALPLMIVPSLVTNIWQALIGGRFVALLRRFWLLLALSAAGAWLGVGILVGADARIMNACLGAALCLYALLGLSTIRMSVPVGWEGWLKAPVGFATGVVSGTTGTIVMPVVLYLEALGLEKDTIVQAMGLSFSVSSLALGLALAGHQAYDGHQLVMSSLALAPATLGMVAGQVLRQRISPTAFRRWLFLALLILGLHLLTKLFS